jgi:hypothetical protein
MSMATPLPGPDPFQMGKARLSVGAFYETGASETIPIDNISSHLYIYVIDGTTMTTAALSPDSDHVEGLSADRVTHAGLTWWGLGVHWDPMMPKSMKAWTKMHVSLKSADMTFASVQIGMKSDMVANVDAGKYGYAADNAWHNLVIPIADFVAAGLDVTKVQAPFILGGGAGKGGEKLLVDDLYFSAD